MAVGSPVTPVDVSRHDPATIRAAQIVLPCADLDPTVDFFVDRLGFRLDAIFPADDPSVAVLSGHGATVRLDTSVDGAAGRLRLLCDEPARVESPPVVAPNGTVIDFVPAEPPVAVPPVDQELVVNRLHDEARWVVGRAGMRYRDLIPGRLGGSFIASHIHIPHAGPVPDYVHFHHVRFQMIFCVKGWVRLVYEDQGEPFVLEAGDCVLQPPRIRHRVLECSADLEVVEIGSPAEHETIVEHTIELPTEQLHHDREFTGQRFTRHRASLAAWQPWHRNGFVHRDLGIGEATVGLAGARVVRPTGEPSPERLAHGTEFQFLFVLRGTVTLDVGDENPVHLGHGDAVSIPGAVRWALRDCSPDLELLDVTLPANVAPQ
ncbi:MAG TPA: cupin domain-containing protein [Ilumatobacteraceae bacterium]|nr:cupin domain-containing protein [Ilumatobacteraceae bacterium]